MIIIKQTNIPTIVYQALIVVMLFSSNAYADIVQNDDVIVEGSLCTSDENSCVDGENFTGFGPTGAQLELKLLDNFPALGLVTPSATDADWLIETLSEDFLISNDESSTTPIRIENGAGDDSLRIAENGFVGIGLDNPVAALDVATPMGETAALKVTNTGGTTNAIHTILNLASNGPPSLRLRDNFNDETWQFRAKQNGGFTMNNAGSPGLEFEIEKDGRVKFSNDVTVNGVVIQSSSKALKENFVGIDVKAVLEKVTNLDIQQWNYISDEDGVKHMGPMAEDFYDSFNLGTTPKGISSVDASGVALAAIQGLKSEKDEDVISLKQQLEDSQKQLLALQQSNDSKEDRITRLEQQLDRLNGIEHVLYRLIDKQAEETPVPVIYKN